MKIVTCVLVFLLSVGVVEAKGNKNKWNSNNNTGDSTFRNNNFSLLCGVNYYKNELRLSSLDIRFSSYGLGFATNDPTLDKPDVDTECPHDDFKISTSTSNFCFGPQYHYEIIPYNLDIFCQIGLIFYRTREIAHSNVTTLTWSHGSDMTDYGFNYGAGLQWYPYGMLAIGASWSEYSKFSFTIGIFASPIMIH